MSDGSNEVDEQFEQLRVGKVTLLFLSSLCGTEFVKFCSWLVTCESPEMCVFITSVCVCVAECIH